MARINPVRLGAAVSRTAGSMSTVACASSSPKAR